MVINGSKISRTLYRNLVYLISYVRKTLNCVDYLALLLVVLLSIYLSCTFHTLHHQLVVRDDIQDKNWSATNERTAELNGLTEICKILLVRKMEYGKTSYSTISIKLRKDFPSSRFTEYFTFTIQLCTNMY